jgi:glycosyltransferase involved in cell wall biosynthesis
VFNKKILIITPYYEPIKGGITTFALKLKEEFSKKNMSVTVITKKGKTSEGVISIEKNKILFVVKSFLSIRKIKPDIIQAFSHWHVVLPGIFYKLLHPKTKVILTFNTEILDDVGYTKRKIIEWILSKCDTTTFVSKYLMNEMEKKFTIKTNKKVIYDGASLNPLAPPNHIQNFKRKFNITDNKPVISSISVFSYKLKVEGLKRLIKAFPDVLNNYPNARLIIVGDGQYKHYLISLINELNLQDSIILTGYMDNVFVPLKISDIYAHVTLQEAGVADTILEAWAVEKPVIASNIGGIPEVVTDNVDGRIIEPIPKEISNTIVNLYKHPDIMSRYGKEGRKTLEKRYSWEKIATEFINTYSSI